MYFLVLGSNNRTIEQWDNGHITKLICVPINFYYGGVLLHVQGAMPGDFPILSFQGGGYLAQHWNYKSYLDNIVNTQ